MDMANVAWAVVTLRHDEKNISPFVEQVMRCCRPIQGMSGISVAIMLWACAKSDADPYQLDLYTVNSHHTIRSSSHRPSIPWVLQTTLTSDPVPFLLPRAGFCSVVSA